MNAGRSRKKRTSSGSRRRGVDLEEAILGAACEVLQKDGYRAFSFDSVARRAGTSRPVLYRRWSSRNELLLATLGRFFADHEIVVPDTGNVRDDAIALLRKANATRARMTVLIGAQLIDFFRDTGTSMALLRQTLKPGEPSPFERVVLRAVERGELAQRAYSSRLVELPMDLLRSDIFSTMKPTSDEALVEMVDDIWLPLLLNHTE
jgi:AcrR family transcriptional regulator